MLANCLSKEITSGFVAFQILGNEIVMALTPKSRLAVWALTSVDLTGILLDSLKSQVGLSCFEWLAAYCCNNENRTKKWCAMSRLGLEKNGYHHATSYWKNATVRSPPRLNYCSHLHRLSKGCISLVMLLDVVCSFFVIFCS